MLVFPGLILALPESVVAAEPPLDQSTEPAPAQEPTALAIGTALRIRYA